MSYAKLNTKCLFEEHRRTSRSYRPEIDGLRAIAVISVILFHLDVPWFLGGFVGVDIFFVISGYLITQNISNDITQGTFTIKGFYTRRIRRLFPALLFTIAATLTMAYFLFTPEHFTRLGKSSIAATLSVSNILFWLESGYFDESKSFKPLLHTWSLAIEEQFYVLWPILLVLLSRLSNKTKLTALIVLGLLSLAASEYFLEKSPSAVFYFMPLRASEFVIGATLVFFSPKKNDHWSEALLGSIGLVLILFAVSTYSSTTEFPGISTLLPTAGAALLILYGRHNLIRPLLQNKAMLVIGKLSYSLYLVHWPIIIFASYWKFGGLGFKSIAVVLPVIFICAVVLYSSVERRFRYRSNDSAPDKTDVSFRNTALAASLLLLLVSTSIINSGGWLWRYPESAKPALYAVEGISNDHDVKRQLTDKFQNEFESSDTEPDRFIIGDSFAQDTFVAIKLALPQLPLAHINILAECQPIIPDDYSDVMQLNLSSETRCNLYREQVFADPRLANAKTIFLAASWREPAISKLGKTLDFLKQNTNAKIIIFGPRPVFKDVPTLILRSPSPSGSANYAYQSPKRDVSQLNGRFHALSKDFDAEYVDLLDIACTQSSSCLVISPFDGKSLYSDHAHWSVSGANWFGAKIADYLIK